jgi:hypothetical protein
MAILTQAINLATRRKLTFQNPEEDHKLDAWIPDFQGGPGHWISPLSVFLETVHDVARYAMGDRKNAAEIATQMAANKLSPLGRALGVATTGYTPMGEKIPTTGGRLAETGKALIPIPITTAAGTRAIGHAVAPNLISPPPHGALQRQIYSSMGLKSETEKGPSALVARMADSFMERNNLKRDTGWTQVRTTDPSVSRLRSALRNEDYPTAKQIISTLLKSRSQQSLVKGIKESIHRPFTGSLKNERLFVRSLTDEQRELYWKAQAERQEIYQRFVEMMLAR